MQVTCRVHLVWYGEDARLTQDVKKSEYVLFMRHIVIVRTFFLKIRESAQKG